MQQIIAFLGPSGTYSEAAARHLYGDAAEYLPCDTFDDAVKTVEQGAANVAVLPIENSTQGSVHRVLDLLADTGLTIQAELVLPIHHQLLGQVKAYGEVAEVWAHPQALGQCRGWLAKNLPNAAQHAARSNAEAAQLAAEQPHAAAIASATAGELYELHVLAKNIEDNPRNTTRFVAVGTGTPQPTSHDKTSLICVLPNRAGSLYGLLGIFAKHGVNLTKLESRPLPDRLWEYRFYIDCDGHMANGQLAAALAEVKMYSQHYKVLGSYAKAGSAS